jgi:hypothetical protein
MKKKTKKVKKKAIKRKGGSILANIAKRTLITLPNEKSFKFYMGINRPTNIMANSLESLIQALKKVELPSIQFHVSRGDFSNWVSGALNDKVLAGNLASLKKLHGEPLRKTIISRVENRYNSLKKALKN